MRTTTRFSGGFLLLFAAAAIIGVFFYYFFFIVKEREEKIIARGYRVLENISKNILDKKSIYDNSIRFYRRDFSNPEILVVNETTNKDFFSGDGYFVFNDFLNQYGYFKKHPKYRNIGGLVSVDNFFKGVIYDDFFSNLSVFDNTATFYNSLLTGLTLHKADTLFSLLNDNIGPFHFESSYGSEKYIVFVRQLSFDENPIYLAGFMDKNTFLGRSRKFNPYVLFAGSILLMYLIVCLPLLKLWLINNYEQIKASDAVRSSLSLIFGGALLTLLAMSIHHYLFVDKGQIDHNLKHFGSSIHDRFKTEVDNVLDQLQHFPKDKIITDPKKLETATWTFHADSIASHLTYYNFNEILFVDAEGFITQFISYEKNDNQLNPKQLRIESRDYFSKVHAGKGWSYPKMHNSDIYLQSIYSWTKATGEAAISVKSTALSENDTINRVISVAALTTPLSSVMNTVVPDGYGFVIIDASGTVQFHSNSRKNLMENFIDETGKNEKLVAAITNHQELHLRIQYNDNQYRAHIRPVKDLPFFIIVFHDMQISRETSARVIMTCFSLILVTILLLGLLFFMIWLYGSVTGKYAYGKSIIDWLRFHGANRELYFGLLCQTLLYLIIQVVFYSSGDSDSLHKVLIFNFLAISFISIQHYILLRFLNYSKEVYSHRWRKIYLHYLPLSAIMLLAALWSQIYWLAIFPVTGLLSLYVLRKYESFSMPNWFNGLACYKFFLFIWICSLAIIPTINLFKVIQQDEAGLWLRDMQLSLYKDYVQRANNLSDTFKSEINAEKKRSYMQANGIYNSFADSSVLEFKQPPDVPGQLYPVIGTFDAELYTLTRPVIAGYHEELRGLISGVVADGEWSWQKIKRHTSNTNGNCDFVQFNVTKANNNAENEYFSIISTSPQFSMPSIFYKSGLVFWCFFVVALGIGYFIVHHTLDQLFHLKFLFGLGKKERSYTMEKLLSKNKKLIIEGFQKASIICEIEKVYPGENLKVISCAEILTTAKLSKKIKTGKAVLITDFNYGAGVSIFDDYRLLLMKNLYRADNTTIVHIENGLAAYFEPPASGETKIKKADVSLQKKEEESLEWFFTDFVSVVYPGDFETIDNETEAVYTSPQEMHDNPELLARNNAGYYTHVWNCLNGAEKLVMFDLEKNSIINTSNQTVIEGMLRKGLLKVSEEKLQLVDLGWTAFLKGNELKREFKQLKHSLRLSGSWHNWRLIIFAVILALCVLLFFSDKEFFSTLNGVIGGAAALIPLLFKLFESRSQQQAE